MTAGKGQETAKGRGLRDWKGRAVLSEEHGRGGFHRSVWRASGADSDRKRELSLAGTVTRSWLGKTKNLPERELQ